MSTGAYQLLLTRLYRSRELEQEMELKLNPRHSGTGYKLASGIFTAMSKRTPVTFILTVIGCTIGLLN